MRSCDDRDNDRSWLFVTADALTLAIASGGRCGKEQQVAVTRMMAGRSDQAFMISNQWFPCRALPSGRLCGLSSWISGRGRRHHHCNQAHQVMGNNMED
mmetsp:Transcript_8171/g.14976  ORF Transcript_8171/g.14976 Transcript_8171/m.14976 type:complete len:99 (-) Transcript_8171:1339-1635(-)